MQCTVRSSCVESIEHGHCSVLSAAAVLSPNSDPTSSSSTSLATVFTNNLSLISLYVTAIEGHFDVAMPVTVHAVNLKSPKTELKMIVVIIIIIIIIWIFKKWIDLAQDGTGGRRLWLR